jgi:hypothetical protein
MLGSVLFGCNVFDGVQPEPSSVDALLADARVAMTNGNSERALRLLETAHDRDSTHIGVRIELANAIYASNDLDLFTVRSAVEHLSGTGDSPPNNGIEPVCTGGGDSAPSSRQFEPIMLEEALEEFASYREQMRRVSRLVVTGGIQRRGEAFSKEPPSARVKGYLLAALTRVSLRLLTIQDEIQDTNTTLYVDVEDATPRAFIACGGTTESIARAERSFCRGAQGTQEAISWLQARNDLIGSDQSSLIIDLLEAHADAMQTRHSCAGATPS